MGDRCYIEIEVYNYEGLSERAKELLNECFGASETSDDENKQFIAEEANWAYHEELQQLVELGVAFTGFHGAGCDYPAARFVSLRRRHVIYSAPFGPVATVYADGTVDKDEIEHALSYHKAYKAATS